jgi:ribosome biogenesis protein BRX1
MFNVSDTHIWHTFFCFLQIRALEKRQKAGKYAKKVKAKVRRKMHEMENTLEPDEFAELWKGE